MKKILFSIAFIIFALCISTVYSFAETDNSTLNTMTNGIRNTVGGAENTVEDAAKGATDAAKSGINNMKDAINDMSNNVKDSTDKAGDNMKNGAEAVGNTMQDGINSITDNGEYTASRTAADGGQSLMGAMNTETWSWIIIGVVAIAIIALFWYYAAHSKNERNHK